MSATVGALGYSLEHASRLKNEGRQDNATQIGARAQLRDDVSENCVHRGQPGVSLYWLRRVMTGKLACESLLAVECGASFIHLSKSRAKQSQAISPLPRHVYGVAATYHCPDRAPSPGYRHRYRSSHRRWRIGCLQVAALTSWKTFWRCRMVSRSKFEVGKKKLKVHDRKAEQALRARKTKGGSRN